MTDTQQLEFDFDTDKNARRKLRELPHNRAKLLLKDAKYRAKINGLKFDLDAIWIRKRIESGRCEVTGEVFDLSVMHLPPGKPNPLGPSLDRRNPKHGYTKKNTRVVTWIYNHAKGIVSDGDIQRMAARLLVAPYLNHSYAGDN